MSDSMINDLNHPFVINNQVFVVGNPVIPVDTLEQLVQHLDHLGAGQPIVIINPQAQAIPGFDAALSNLIQNNRTRQVYNVTSEDRYKFREFTDEQIFNMAESDLRQYPGLDRDLTYEMYSRLKIRAEALYALDMMIRERDQIWAYHCANPQSNEGFSRYQELQNLQIPQQQAYYNSVCARLQEIESLLSVQRADIAARVAAMSVVTNNTNTVNAETRAANVETRAANVESVTVNTNTVNTTANTDVRIWAPWLSVDYLLMPLEAARSMLDTPMYSGLRNQQHDCVVDNVTYKAVEPEYLIALGIPVYPDGLPIVYTELGKFKRVGTSNQPLTNLDYWYPVPRRGI